MAYFFYIDGVGTIISVSTSYGSKLGLDNISMILALLMTQIVAVPFSILFGRLAEKLGALKTLRGAVAIYFFICLVGFYMGFKKKSQLIPDERSNEYFGFFDIFGKFAAVIGPLLVAAFTQLTGRDSIGVISLAILFLLGFVLLQTGQKSLERK